MERDLNISTACQACRLRPITQTVANEFPGEPFRLCDPCSERLQLRALRPLEWFNLSALHGSGGLLHDDYYDEHGVASDPEVDHYCVDGLTAPTLDEASRSLDHLVDYCIAKWWLNTDIYAAFDRFPRAAILEEIDRRSQTRSAGVWAVLFDLCANVLRQAAEVWVRDHYARAVNDDFLFGWAAAAASCLPRDEGLEKTFAALQAHSGEPLRTQMLALGWFRSGVVLDWIEVHAPRQNVTPEWGNLAAWSDLSWSRVDKWLSAGRPLSFVALDALAVCIPAYAGADLPPPSQPGLKGLPDRATVTSALEACLAADSVPRVEMSCRYILENLSRMRVE